MLSTLLNCIDGVDSATTVSEGKITLVVRDEISIIGIFIVAATNRISLVDSALLRPGRLDELIEIGLPSQETCLDILTLHLAHVSMHHSSKIRDFFFLQ